MDAFRLRSLRDSIEIIRDEWGVPHIYARNIDDLFFAQGYVQAQDRRWQMDMYRRTYEGRLAEIMGPSHITHDRLMRLLAFRGPFTDRERKSYHPEGRSSSRARRRVRAWIESARCCRAASSSPSRT